MSIRADFQLLANIMDHAPALICAVDPHGQLQHVGGACRHVLGQENNQLVGQDFAAIVHPEDRAVALAACAQAMAQDGPVHFESRCLNPAGEEVVVEWSAFRPPADALLLCIGRDVTEQRRAARHAREQEAHHRAVTEHGFDMTGLLDEDGRYLHVGASIIQALGYQPEELIGRVAFDFIHPDDLAAVQAKWAEQGKQSLFTIDNYRFRAANGEWRWMESSISNQLLNPKIRAYTAISRDVTEQQQAARRVLEQEEFYRAVAEHGFDIMTLLSAEGVYTYVGGSVQKALGYVPEQMLGHSPFEFIHPDDVAEAQAAWAEVGTQPVFAVPDCRFRAANGEWRWMETTVGNQLLNPAIQAFTLCSRDITDKKNRAFELAASEQRFRLLFEHKQTLAFFQDADGLVVDMNPAYLNFLQMTREQVVHRHPNDFLSASLTPGAEEDFQAALRGQQLTYETSVVNDGVERTFAVTKTPLVVEGQTIGVSTTGRDITEMVAAQRLIKRQADQLQNILENVTDAFMSLDHDWNLSYINREAERILGVEREKLLGKNLWDVFPTGRDGLFHQRGLEAFETGSTVQFETYANSLNRWLGVKMFPSPDGLGIYFSDITARVEADKQLKMMALVAQGTLNSVVITDAEGRVEWVNAGFTKDTGYTLADMLGKKPGEVLQGSETDPAAVRRFQERLHLQKPFSVTILNYKKSGQKLWFSIDVTPIFNDAGELTQFIAIQQNINFRKEVEASQAKMTQELYRHNRDLQQFTYVVSHNLRAPLANALGLANLLTKVDRQGPVFETSLAHLRQSMGQADTVLKDLNMVLSIRDKQDVDTAERVVLADVCQQAVANMDEALQQCGGLVKIVVPDDLALRGNRAYLYSIFYNLLSNSIKYRAEGRTLLVEIACCYNETGGISITFTDNGSGFDMFKAGSDVFQLYKRFHTNQRGRGIGLFLVKTHVDALGGKIEVTSGVDFGTRFLIKFNAQ